VRTKRNRRTRLNLNFRFARHLGGTGVGFWLVPMARGFVALRDEKTRENSNFRNTEMANIKTEGVSART